jgi:hypothetical protein
MISKELIKSHAPRKHKGSRHFFTEEEDNIIRNIMLTSKPES